MAGTVALSFTFLLLLPLLTLSSIYSPVQRAENIVIPIGVTSGPKNSSKRTEIEQDGKGLKIYLHMPSFGKEVSRVHSQAITTAECANFREVKGT
eukprot:1393135-Amorphochlora_amoeboformis.AAC.1